ncbi:FadR/GntR family transcriptional regulator [Mycolicibacter longobardus]|uniref:FadR/GntR family transcriptional regulator n=1 Tax=Mycolicibacter longobardus TaxID=1108812 RepID=UPI0013FDE05F|nr:GntR family transcriptional regulator [Mycolicibacter longobardus]MCV7383452.1 FadR family transcriptional regulator [Mycolicibacter longobardus]
MAPRRTPAVSPAAAAPRAVKAVDGVIDSLRQDIVSQRLPQASRLPNERDLAAHYGVSQPTIREAVRALAAMGLVEVRHGSGAYVRGDSDYLVATALQILMQMKDVGLLEALDVRTALGMQSARAAATHATAEDLEQLDIAYAALDSASKLRDHDMLIRAVAGFQIALSRAGHNALTTAIETVLVSLIMHMQFKALRSRGIRYWQQRTTEFQPDRRRILDGVAAHDPEAAADAMAAYLDHQRRYFTDDPELARLRLSDPRAARILDEVQMGVRDWDGG